MKTLTRNRICGNVGTAVLSLFAVEEVLGAGMADHGVTWGAGEH
jgi:hypothetical protein